MRFNLYFNEGVVHLMAIFRPTSTSLLRPNRTDLLNSCSGRSTSRFRHKNKHKHFYINSHYKYNYLLQIESVLWFKVGAHKYFFAICRFVNLLINNLLPLWFFWCAGEEKIVNKACGT
jgi:hypothetical protein